MSKLVIAAALLMVAGAGLAVVFVVRAFEASANHRPKFSVVAAAEPVEPVPPPTPPSGENGFTRAASPQSPFREKPGPVASPGGTTDGPALPDDRAILTELHSLAASDPGQSLKLARAALRRSPSGPDAPELEWNVVKALYNMGRLDEAKDEARVMVRDYPGDDFSGDVVRHLLNPQPNP